ncbi:hypothetical protein BC938DRAFT_471017 [Jimgerdemannia flammicorona]|uniref:rRNA-processing protein EFG1 n=1 Tax=Jimgerdemannia flammicorona TaxID=994334 RepID=A0A433QUU4_9FUNG|nr:hypothetical protein BC938DRAFT_471017 [Jimgerdemannia flammicorona]
MPKGPSKNFRKTFHKPYDDDDAVPTSLTAIKKRLRDTERSLKHDKASAKVRLESERSLKALQMHLTDKQMNEIEKKFALKYRMVKFFERQKVLRKIKRAEKRVEDASSDTERYAEQATLDELKVDLNYILHFPKTEKYVSLFPKFNADNPQSSARRIAIRGKIREAMRNGVLEEGVIEREFREQKKQMITSRMHAKANRGTAKKRERNDDNEQEGEGEENRRRPTKPKVAKDAFFMGDSEDD